MYYRKYKNYISKMKKYYSLMNTIYLSVYIVLVFFPVKNIFRQNDIILNEMRCQVVNSFPIAAVTSFHKLSA